MLTGALRSKGFLVGETKVGTFWTKLTRILKKLDNIPQEVPLIQKYIRLYIRLLWTQNPLWSKPKVGNIWGSSCLRLRWIFRENYWSCYYGKNTTLLYTMRHVGKTPFYYLIHKETCDHRGSTGTGKDAELNKRLL